MRLSGWTLLVCAMALWLFTIGLADAGTITVQQYRDGGAGRIVVPITNTLDTGDAPSTLQFDLQYDPAQITPVERFFLEPTDAAHRQYEALRAFFIEGLPSHEAARRFG